MTNIALCQLTAASSKNGFSGNTAKLKFGPSHSVGVESAYFCAGNWDAYAFHSATPATASITCSECNLNSGAATPPVSMEYYKLWVEPKDGYEYPVYFAFPSGFIRSEKEIIAIAKSACLFLCSGEEEDLACPTQVSLDAFLHQEYPEDYIASLIAEED